MGLVIAATGMEKQPPARVDWGLACDESDLLFALLAEDVLYERPIPERHRVIFYLGHLEAFDWNLVRAALDQPTQTPELDRLFAFGIDPPPGELPFDLPSDWPRLQTVIEYARQTRNRIGKLIELLPEIIRQVMIEHRLEHAETLAYMLHNFPADKKRAPQGLKAPAAKSKTPVAARKILIPAGEATLGRARYEAGWDNEFDEHREAVNEFRVDRYKVTNGDYLKFVEAGGTPSHFWQRRNGEWYWRGMFSTFPLPLHGPVYVTQQQAADYAAWKGGQLPSEAQFHRAAFGTPVDGPEAGRERNYPWGMEFSMRDSAGRPRGNFNNFGWDPVPVNATPAGDSAFGVAQLVGNGWEWTRSVFAPFPGFQALSFYPGYSANFFDGTHFVLKGGSPRTAAPLLRRSFRNWFRPEYPYVYAAFRCVMTH